jgi:hypothetical protein
MKRRVSDEGEAPAAKQFECSLLGLTEYPDPEDGFEPVLSYVLHEVVPKEAADDPLVSTAVFLTRDPVSAMWREVDPMATKAPGFLCVVRGAAHDVLFYLSAALRADGFVYMFDRDTTHEEPIYAVWDRLEGLAAFVKRSDKLIRLPPEAVKHVLPATISGDDAAATVVH